MLSEQITVQFFFDNIIFKNNNDSSDCYSNKIVINFILKHIFFHNAKIIYRIKKKSRIKSDCSSHASLAFYDKNIKRRNQ